MKAKRRPIAALWAIKTLARPTAHWMPDEVAVLLDGEPNGVSLTLVGWSAASSISPWSYERIAKNLRDLQLEWDHWFAPGWLLEIRESPRQPQVAGTPGPTKDKQRLSRISVVGQLEFESQGVLVRAVRAFLKHPAADNCAVTKADLHITGHQLRMHTNESLPASCWSATLRTLETLANAACGGELTATCDDGAEVVEFPASAAPEDDDPDDDDACDDNRQGSVPPPLQATGSLSRSARRILNEIADARVADPERASRVIGDADEHREVGNTLSSRSSTTPSDPED